MTRAWFLVVALEALATVSAWRLSRQAPAHRPVFWTLLLVLLCDLTGRILIDTLLRVPGPHMGPRRAAFHVTEALFCAYPAAVAALALHLATGRRRPAAAVGATYAIFVAALVTLYPWLRTTRLEWAYTGGEIAIVIACVAALVIAWRRRVPLATAHAVAFVLVLAEAMNLVGPFLSAQPLADWHFAQITYACAFGAATLLNLEALWTTRRSTFSSV